MKVNKTMRVSDYMLPVEEAKQMAGQLKPRHSLTYRWARRNAAKMVYREGKKR